MDTREQSPYCAAAMSGPGLSKRVNFTVLAVQADVGSALNNDQIGDPLRRSKGANFCRTHPQQIQPGYRP